jgi:hypothetical protein
MQPERNNSEHRQAEQKKADHKQALHNFTGGCPNGRAEAKRA